MTRCRKRLKVFQKSRTTRDHGLIQLLWGHLNCIGAATEPINANQRAATITELSVVVLKKSGDRPRLLARVCRGAFAIHWDNELSEYVPLSRMPIISLSSAPIFCME